MNKINFCQTPFQVIVSLLIRKQYSDNTQRFDIVIVNSFSGYEKIARKLQEKNVFDNVYVAEVKDFILAKGKLNNVKKAGYILMPKHLIRKHLPNIAGKYDEMFCWNYDTFTASFRSVYSNKISKIKLNIFDEGYITYLPVSDTIPKRGFMKIIDILNILKGMPSIKRENVYAYYLLEPEAAFFQTDAKVYEIDRKQKNEKEFVELIDYLFDAADEVKKYDRKYIILEEALLANVPDVNDEKVFDNIINAVGKENVLIKLHPRTNKDRFTEKGVKTIGQSGVPFEALALCGDFSNKVLIGISCGTIPTYRMLFGEDFDGYMLFKYVKPNVPWFKDKYVGFWDRLEAQVGNRGIHFPNTEKELLEQLKKGS